MTDTSSLFRPFEHKTLRLRNRVCMAPMTREKSPGGVPTDEVVAYYTRRAKHQVGLIITEGTVIDHPVSMPSPDVPRMYGSDALEGWKKVVKGVHGEGGAIMAQLWHVGMMRKPGTEPNPTRVSQGPSGLVKPGKASGQAMSLQDIDDVMAAFTTAAATCKGLGFDGVELHGAHGYLLDQFLWEGTNQRDDQYGGPLKERLNFVKELIEAVRAAVGPEYPISLRFSQWKAQDYEAKLVSTPAELESLLLPLSEAGVDIFHASTRRFWEPEFPNESQLNLAGWTRKITGKPTITVGSVGLDQEFLTAFVGQGAAKADLGQLLERMEAGEFDLVAVGRALLQDPEWVEKVRDGRLDAIQDFDAAARDRLF